jgi:AcrR family transcriptional regulator
MQLFRTGRLTLRASVPNLASRAPRRVPVQERSTDTVNQILDAASTLLGSNPLDQITTGRSAAQGTVSIGGLYRFFPDKQAIIDAIAVRRVSEFQKAVETRLASVTALDGPSLLDLMIDVYVDFLDANPDFQAIALGRHVSALTREQQIEPGAGPASLLSMFMPGESGLDLKLRIAIEAGERLIDFAFSQKPPNDRAPVIAEMKQLLTGYLFGAASDKPSSI